MGTEPALADRIPGGRPGRRLDRALRDEAPGAVEDGLARGARFPAEDAAGLLRAVPVAAAERGGDLAQRQVPEAGGEADGEVRERSTAP